MQSKRPGRILRRVLWSAGIVLVVLVAGALTWTQVGVLQAEEAPLRGVAANPDVVMRDAPEGIVLSPAEGDPQIGLIFIPGGKVAPESYAAMLQDVVTELEATVVITRPWLNLAFFDPRGVDSFTSAAPDIDTWAVGGHSLGGVRACMLAEQADALVLFASYCATDLTDAELSVLSLSGTEDGLSTPAKIADARHLLPADATMIEIDGASHASFGDYGEQSGDGDATISSDDLRGVVTTELEAFLSPGSPRR